MINLFHNYDILNQVIAAAYLQEATGLFYSMQDSMKLMEQIMLFTGSGPDSSVSSHCSSPAPVDHLFGMITLGNRMYYKHCLKKAGESNKPILQTLSSPAP